MFTEKELICLPNLTIGIPVGHNVAALVMHLLRNELENIKISLEDLRSEGATLVISAHIKPYPNEEMKTPEEQEKMKSLSEFWANYMAEQKHKLGLDNPLTMEQIERSLQLIEEERIKFASENCWSQETIEYNEQFENELYLWGGEDNDNE